MYQFTSKQWKKIKGFWGVISRSDEEKHLIWIFIWRRQSNTSILKVERCTASFLMFSSLLLMKVNYLMPSITSQFNLMSFTSSSHLTIYFLLGFQLKSRNKRYVPSKQCDLLCVSNIFKWNKFRHIVSDFTENHIKSSPVCFQRPWKSFSSRLYWPLWKKGVMFVYVDKLICKSPQI